MNKESDHTRTKTSQIHINFSKVFLGVIWKETEFADRTHFDTVPAHLIFNFLYLTGCFAV